MAPAERTLTHPSRVKPPLLRAGCCYHRVLVSRSQENVGKRGGRCGEHRRDLAAPRASGRQGDVEEALGSPGTHHQGCFRWRRTETAAKVKISTHLFASWRFRAGADCRNGTAGEPLPCESGERSQGRILQTPALQLARSPFPFPGWVCNPSDRPELVGGDCFFSAFPQQSQRFQRTCGPLQQHPYIFF